LPEPAKLGQGEADSKKADPKTGRIRKNRTNQFRFQFRNFDEQVLAELRQADPQEWGGGTPEKTRFNSGPRVLLS